MSIITLRFKAYSLANIEAYDVIKYGRIRGTNKGHYKLIFGRTIEDSERMISLIRKEIRSNQKIKFENNKRGSFEIKLWV